MSLLEAIILGIIQGLTEFLPVSSSGHLEMAKAIIQNESLPKESLLFTVVVHAATALSTIVIFRKDIGEILKGLFLFKTNHEFHFSMKIIVSMVPAALIGVLFDEQIEHFFNGEILLVGCMLLVTALLLLLADRAKNTINNVTYANAIIIGLSQAIAILPGISRSGATISTSVLLGIDREKSARFSFLMVVPLIFGKMAKDLIGGEFVLDSGALQTLGLGFIAAFITGMIACRLMIRLVKNSKLTYFSIYCFIVGLLAISSTWI